MDGANITFGFLHISNVETRLKIGIKGSDIQREREREIGNLNRRVSSYKVIRQCIPNMYARRARCLQGGTVSDTTSFFLYDDDKSS